MAFTLNSDFNTNNKVDEGQSQLRNDDASLPLLCKDLSKIHEYASNADSSHCFLHDTQTSAQEAKLQGRGKEPA